MFILFRLWVRVLFDYGVSHSFVVTSCVKYLGLNVEALEKPLYVNSPLGTRVSICHALDPGPTRLANPNRFWGAKPYVGTPYFFILFYYYFFSELNLYLWYTNNFCNNQQSFTFTNGLPPEWYPLKFIHIY